MRPTFLGFEASKTALFASQKALDITGNNLANISSKGYTRQRVDQVSAKYHTYATKGYMGVRTALAGEGTSILGIGQTRDKQLDTALRQQCSDIGEFQQRGDILSGIEEALQEFDIGEDGNGYGIRDAISTLYNSLQDFSIDTSSATYAAVVVDAFDNLAATLNEKFVNLEEVGEKYKVDLQTYNSVVNNGLAKIAAINKDIRESMVSNQYTEQYGPNELLDERNLLIDEISTYGEVGVKYNSDGTVDVTIGGHKAVDGEIADSIVYRENSDGTVNLTWKSAGQAAVPGRGILSATVDLLNGRGPKIQNSNETLAKGIPYYKDKLNTLATYLSDMCNNTIPEDVDASGNILSYKKLFGADMRQEDGSGDVYTDMYITAENIAISNELNEDSNYLLFDNGGNTDNTYILNLVAKLSSTQIDFGDFKGTFEDFISDYTTGLGNDVSYAYERYDSAVLVGNNLSNYRDSVMGVSETEETTNMLAYNRAFQAASRMMTVMDELLDVIINRMAV
ncbi:MAG: flagellar hook-associated protein FlgK [Ruminococcus sp.]|nr:flagellar hook-associated protein FlgK [Ruminococcus sp.]